jgi:DNA-binding NarL/FixJ family response regulator
MAGSGGLDTMLSYDLNSVALTRDEQAVLAASVTGRGVADVAAFLELPSEAVRRLIASCVEKLGARSKLEAVIIAMRNGLIDLPDA